jgi:hypothetical protein
MQSPSQSLDVPARNAAKILTAITATSNPRTAPTNAGNGTEKPNQTPTKCVPGTTAEEFRSDP